MRHSGKTSRNASDSKHTPKPWPNAGLHRKFARNLGKRCRIIDSKQPPPNRIVRCPTSARRREAGPNCKHAY